MKDKVCTYSEGCDESTDPKCSGCIDGYYFSNDKCTKCPTGSTCELVSTTVTINGCLDDYYYNSTSCKYSEGCKTVSGTTSVTSCQGCRDGYALFRGACRKLSKVYISSGTQITENYKSVLTGTISETLGLVSTSCIAGAYLYKEEVCLDCTAPTAVFLTKDKFVPTTGGVTNCSTCTLSASFAITCSDCQGNNIYKDGKCDLCGANCIDRQCATNGHGKCDSAKCKDKFGLDSNN